MLKTRFNVTGLGVSANAAVHILLGGTCLLVHYFRFETHAQKMTDRVRMTNLSQSDSSIVSQVKRYI